MSKIDRLGWTAGLTFRSYGVTIGLRVNNAEVLNDLLTFLPPEWTPSRARTVNLLYSLMVGGASGRPNIRRFNMLYANATRVVRSLEMDEVFQAFESHSHLYIAELAPRRVFVHAGVVGWKGQAILMPGRSFAGKTSLVAEFVRAGATYYSDEYAVLDAQGRVHPYSRPLAIRPTEGGASKKHEVEELGGHAGTRPLPVGLVLVSSYKAGAKWRPRPLSAGKGALALLDNTISIRRQPEAAFDVMERVVSQAHVLKSARGEARETVRSILNKLGD